VNDELADGQSKAVALRAAKLDLLRTDATAAPRYWAPFVLIGEADERVPISGPPWWLRNSQLLMLSGLLLMAGLITLLVIRKGNITAFKKSSLRFGRQAPSKQF